MAVSKKYAGLPDLDAAPEVYETPELADDVSTVPTGTVRTISPSPSDDDEARPGLDRQPLDRDGARRRFEPSVVDARDVDFSDSVGGTRRAYRTCSSRRRRRWLQGSGIDEGGGDPSDSEEETLATKLARLRREAEEVRLELERREREKEQEKDEDGEFKDSLEEQQQHNQGAGGAGGEDEDMDVDGVRELSRVLDGLSMKAKLKAGTSAEDEFMSRLNSSSLRQGRRHQQREIGAVSSKEEAAQAAPATLSAVAAFSDRLTALESALGVSSTSAASQTGAILPTLASLSTQVTTLSATLAPQSIGASGETLPSTSASQTNTALLETISAKLKTLIAESDRLAASRKQALASLADLHDKRMQQLVSATVHSNTTRPRLRGLSTTSSSAAAINAHANDNKQGELTDVGPGEESLQIQSRLFLDEQSAKITALYNVLPTIQNLQPLLPVVLERLRTLSVIHDGAAQAKGLVDELESRQGETREEIARWREAVETVEKGMEELEGVMKENVEVIGGRVGEMEGRIGRLEGAR
ncbi:uncharacterized protein Z520_05209 [Fonsecaea multimorphosa CBS 102226]|uniref:Dynactin subunit 2 n=1 Tax=Fonsecaea multimorphosa CBS 102226 TaxID=1442371 RepID=A0A0D2KPT7_9EURO|nr:uncharacterized protein Z520_05209 [Fonsecaea multimorphosa CBS 102226]KIX98748.1 hypothetical protein Z520_05209 [Fonsecaea multimorphosa CBS 102226]OAL25031.1 hypothetical protein AYO22_04908 [Fonsecaea multimorphosa]